MYLVGDRDLASSGDINNCMDMQKALAFRAKAFSRMKFLLAITMYARSCHLGFVSSPCIYAPSYVSILLCGNFFYHIGA